MTAVAMDTAPPRAAAVTLGERHWRVAAIALLSARFIQGFIYWGGGSRRFIYGPEKLHPDAPTRSRRIANVSSNQGFFSNRGNRPKDPTRAIDPVLEAGL
jgi:hypothetical protein